MKELSCALSATTYPGRGILLGVSECGNYGIIAYFIMGRSTNSRNRIFACDGDAVRTRAFDESKVVDPSLIIYAPLRMSDRFTTIVTNGDQTDTVYDALKLGGSFQSALRTREFEPDAPNFTPRISGIFEVKDAKPVYKLSILKSEGEGKSCERFFFEYASPLPGEGRLIHTYQGDGDPLPSFAGEPTKVRLTGSFEQIADTIWTSLNEDNKVSLLVRKVDIATGAYEQMIFNKNK